VREELVLDPAELGGNPWSAAGVSFCLFSISAILPAMPFLWSTGETAIVECIGFSMLHWRPSEFFTSVFNGRSAGFSAVRQILVGLAAAAFTFGVGRVLGGAVVS